MENAQISSSFFLSISITDSSSIASPPPPPLNHRYFKLSLQNPISLKPSSSAILRASKTEAVLTASIKDGSAEQFLENDSIADFMRFQRNSGDKGHGELQTAIVTYRKKFRWSVLQSFLQNAISVKGMDKNQVENLVEIASMWEERVASLYEDSPSIANKDLDHDPVALILGRDNRRRVKGMGDGVSKTSIKYLDPYKKALQKEHELQVILQNQVDNLEKRLEVESRELRLEMDQMFASLFQANTQMRPSTERGSSSQRADLRWNRKLEDMEKLATLQDELLDAASK